MRRVPDLVARPLSTQALSDLLDRKPHLLRPLAKQYCRRALRSIRRSVSGSVSIRCVRRRIAGKCCQLFWPPLRTARLRPPRPRKSRGGCGPSYARSGASDDLRPPRAQTGPNAVAAATPGCRPQEARTGYCRRPLSCGLLMPELSSDVKPAANIRRYASFRSMGFAARLARIFR